ncbi:MAG TPA: hypothetical protein VK395_05380 [Gemmataceae bacterium]|nr:hypothetical protein [Gemmataceae bacterium]
MGPWYRVFGSNDRQPAAEAIARHLQGLGIEAAIEVDEDDLGWYRLIIGLAVRGQNLRIERFLSSEQGVRAELNTWAAWLETREENPHHESLMQRIIATSQLIAWQCPGERPAILESASPSIELCRLFAGATDGIYHVDDQGFFNADGALLVKED